MRRNLISTQEDVYLVAITDEYNESEVGNHLVLTDYINSERIAEGVKLAKVNNVLQAEQSYAGFLEVNSTFNSSLFFWFFPSQHKANEAPLLLWLEGGPGWPTMYALFKENGPFLVGWNSRKQKTYLLRNRFTWTLNHNLLYIDNPVGTGFSFTDSEEGFLRTDEEVAASLIEAMRQFMKLLPYMVEGATAASTPFYAFGQSYGGAYVVSFAHVYLHYRENDPLYIKDIQLKGIGIGNGFINSADQSLYADYVSNLGYVTETQYKKMKSNDDSLLESLSKGDYKKALDLSHTNLYYLVEEVMNLTNIYDFTFDQNYLTNHEYACFLKQPHVRRAIHVGTKKFNDGTISLFHLNQTIMVSKKAWLEEVLERGGIEVLIYNGNLDIIVNVAGTNRMVNSLNWSGKGEFIKSKRKNYWVWNEEEARVEMAGYVNEGGGLTYLIVRNAGHFVPISQPRWAHDLVTQFTHHIPGSERYGTPPQIKRKSRSQSYYHNCS